MKQMTSQYDYRKGWQINPAAQPEAFDAKVPHIDNGTDPIDPSRYGSVDYMRKEWDHLWTKIWTIACPISDIPKVGDFVTYEIARESFIIVRTSSDRVQAFYNVCPHRGNVLVHGESGSRPKGFVCSFHSWRFSVDGKLTEVVDPETFRDGVICRGTGLTEVRCEVLAGLVFINMDENAPKLDEQLGVLSDHLRTYAIDTMIVVRHTRSEFNANWKIGVDTALEPYHFHSLHPQTLDMLNDYGIQQDLYARGISRLYIPYMQMSPRKADQHSVNDFLKAMLVDVGIDPSTFSGTAADVRKAIQAAKRVRAKELGLDYSGFVDSQLSDSVSYTAFPNTVFGLHPEAVIMFRFLPHASDPERHYWDIITMYRPVKKKDGTYIIPAWMDVPPDVDLSGKIRPKMTKVGIGEEGHQGIVFEQDGHILADVHRGSCSRGFKGALLSEQEQRIRHFHVELNRYLDADHHSKTRAQPRRA